MLTGYAESDRLFVLVIVWQRFRSSSHRAQMTARERLPLSATLHVSIQRYNAVAC